MQKKYGASEWLTVKGGQILRSQARHAPTASARGIQIIRNIIQLLCPDRSEAWNAPQDLKVICSLQAMNRINIAHFAGLLPFD